MKIRISNIGYMASVLCLGLVMLCSACSDDDPSPGADVLKKLSSKPWKVSSVQVDGTDQTALFTGMTLTFTAKDYHVEPANAIWPANGTWMFTNTEGTVIERNDGLELTVMEITETSLKLSLQWNKNTFGPGRAASVSGQHLFVFESL